MRYRIEIAGKHRERYAEFERSLPPLVFAQIIAHCERLCHDLTLLNRKVAPALVDIYHFTVQDGAGSTYRVTFAFEWDPDDPYRQKTDKLVLVAFAAKRLG